MSNKFVSTTSNKATLKNEGFLSKLASTLISRLPPEKAETQTTLTWHKTSEVKERIKTATGTIPVYKDMTQEQVEELKESVAGVPSLEEYRKMEDEYVATSIIAEAASKAVQILSDPTKQVTSEAIYIATDDYTPDDAEGLPLVNGQKVMLIDTGSPYKRARIEDADDLQLLDNSAAKHKMTIRPKKNHPDPRSRGHETHDERWLVKDAETGKEGLVPSKMLEIAPAGTIFATSIKRSIQEMSTEESMEIKRKLTKELKDIKSLKKRKSSSKILGPTPEEEARIKRAATIRELIETEEEFAKDLQFVMDNYYSVFDADSTPKDIRDQKEAIFSNFKYISEFHQNVLIEGVKYHAQVPNLIGKTFLRLERDFDKHSEYCSNEPMADAFIENNPYIKDYFEEISLNIVDDKRLQEHLKLPIQRLNDYQLLLKELVKFSTRLGDDTTDLERAFDLMQSVPQRATDSKFLASIEGFKGNLYKLGRLIRHDWFTVTEKGHKPRDRYLFLFKARILITKVKKIAEDRSIFVLRDIIRLPETSLSGTEQPKILEFHHIEPQNHQNFPIVLETRTPEIRDAWLAVVQEHVIDTASVEDLLFDDELRVVSEEGEDLLFDGGEEEELKDLEFERELDQVVPELKLPETLPVKVPLDKAVEQTVPIEEPLPWEVDSQPPERKEEEQIIEIQVEPSVVKEKSPPIQNQVVPSEQKVEETLVDAKKINEEVTVPEVTPILTEVSKKEAEFLHERVESSTKRQKEKEESAEEVDFWVREESSPPLKKRNLLQQETLAKESIFDVVETSVTESKEVLPPEKPPQEPVLPITSETKEDKKEEGFDFWGIKEQSPTPKTSVIQDNKDEITFVVPEVVSHSKEELNLEQVETPAFKAEEKVAERKQKVTQQKNEDTKQEVPAAEPKVQDFPSRSEIKEESITPQIELEKNKAKLTKKEKKDSEQLISKFEEPQVNKKVETKGKKVDKKKEEKTKTSEDLKPEIVQPLKPFKDLEKLDKKDKEGKEYNLKKDSSPHTLIESPATTTVLITEVDSSATLKQTVVEPSLKDTKVKPTVSSKTTKVEPPVITKTSEKDKSSEVTSKGSKKSSEKEPPTSLLTTKEEVSVSQKPTEKEPLVSVKTVETKSSTASKTKEVKSTTSPKTAEVKSAETLQVEEVKATIAVEPPVPPKTKEVKPPPSTKTTEKSQKPKESSKAKDLESAKPSLTDTSEPKKEELETKSKKESKKEKLEKLEIDKGVKKEKKLKKGESPPRTAPEKELASTMSQQTPSTPSSGPRPVFTKTLTGEVVEPGEGATFVCEVAHPSAYYVTWLKDNKALDDKLADRVQQTDDGNKHTLKIVNCRTEDTGIYTAKATDQNGSSATCSAQLLVQQLTPEEREARIAEKKPFFLVKMIPTEVIENTNLSYAVHVKGNPMPKVVFYKDTKVLIEDDRLKIHRDVEHGKYELLISHVQHGDAGIYKCKASNSFGTTECEAVMSVADEVQALQNLSGKGSLLHPGESAEFKWFRDGVEFDPLERFNVMFKDEEDTLALVFQNVTPDDAGIYTCVASTSCGKISCSAELTVEGSINRLMKDPEPPSITEELQDVRVALDGTAMLECRISGFPKPELEWSHDGNQLKIGGRVKQLWEDDEGVTLLIKNANEDDKGKYTVVAKNELGESKTSCNLIIKRRPKFMSMEKLVGCNIGQPLNYIVEVDGEPVPEIKWLKDGKELHENNRIKFEAGPDGKFYLKISKMTPEDCGAYSIVASNDMGQRSEQFEVQADTPPEITRGLDPETEKKFNNDHTFEVRGHGSPSPTATWFKNGKEINTESGKYKVAMDGQYYMLTVKSITTSDKGTYKIVLTNNSGSAQSEGAFLVRGPPDFTSPLEDACAKEGAKNIKLTVKWDSHPRPTIKWMHEDKPIHEETEGYSISTDDNGSTLTIQVAKAEFVGNYSIKASNEYGDASCGARFRLHEAPQILEPLKDVEFLEGDKCKYQCKVSGVPKPDIRWTKDGQKYTADEVRVLPKKEGDEVYILYFDGASTEDSGRYVATLSNVEGNVTTEGSIIVNTPPHIKGSNFRDGITFIAMHKLVLEVEASAVPEAEATWYCNGKELKDQEDSVKFSFDGKIYRMERIGSDPEQSGEYKCKLKNKIKENVESGTVTIIEKESRVRQALKDVNVTEKTNGTIQCQIVGDPIPTVQWYRNGELITSSERIEIKEDKEKRMHYLVFKDVDERDKSTFTCKGTNEHGNCETSCLMTIFVVPRPGELQDVVVDYGRDLTLNVHVHAIPIPDVVWFKDGKKIEENERIQSLRNEEEEIYSLVVKSVVLEDAATYTYKATNVVGETTGKSVAKIHTEKPTIVTELEEQNICLEDEVTFVLRFAGLPIPDVEWKNKNEVVNNAEKYTVNILESDVHTITLKDVAIGDYGKITARAHNLVGDAMSTAELIQMTLPCEVLEGLENFMLGADGDDVTLGVKIKGSPRPTFVWTKDGDELESSAKFTMSRKTYNYCEETLYLTINCAADSDSGQYRLRFFNEVNEAQSETALVIKPIRRIPKISNVPGDLTVSAMQPGMFKCKINGYPKPEVKWLKDGRVVRPTDILNTGCTANGEYFLEFKHVTLEDAGRYTVVATNDEGVVQCDMHLAVNPIPSKPEFLQGLKSTKVIEGYPCRMEVQLGGFPRPKVTWTKNGKPIEIDGDHIKEIVTDDGRVILQIATATDADKGEYSAVASNGEGESSSSATLSVLDHDRKDGQPDGPSKFTEGLKDSCFDEGKTIRLPVSVKGGPVPDMKWYKDGEEIKLGERTFFTYDGDKTYLEIYPCAGADSGRYKCVVENSNGKAETECEVTVRKCFETPAFTYKFKNQQQLPGGDVKFAVKVDGVPKPELSWFYNGKPIVPDGEKYRLRKDADGCTLFVKDVTYSDSGSYKCVAKNREGQAEHQATLTVADNIDPNRKYEAPTILKAIGDQELYENYTAKFKALVTGKPLPEFEWYRNGSKLYPNNRITTERDEEGIIRLTIKHVCQEDAGIYELEVWNEHGKDSCRGKLICECLSKDKKRPVGDEYKGFEKVRQSGVTIPLPDKPIISALSDRRCTLSWYPYLPAHSVPPVTYQVEMCECPEGDWITARTGIRGCSVDISDLAPKSDYKFRVRVENKYGVSEPSPYVGTYRNKLEREPISYEPLVGPLNDTVLDGPLIPSGFQINRDADGNFYSAPRFLKLDHDTQYGMKNFIARIKWVAFGYPTPKVRFYYKDEEIHFGSGSKYTYSQEATGEICLFVDKLNEHDVGWYKCEVFNEYGESHQRIRLGLSEYPKVLQHLQETYIRTDHPGRIFCRISAYPPCDVTWFKDWKEIKPSSKMRPQFIEPDMYCLNFNHLSVADYGLYSMAAVNVAGAVSSSCMVHVVDSDVAYNWLGHAKGINVGINTKRGTLEDHYDIGDELGRGTQGVTYHCVEHFTGRNFAAKSMWGTGDFKLWMHNEYEMMNLIGSCKRVARLFDAYEGPKNMVLVTELCAGGELLGALTRLQYLTEYEVAHYIRQVLEGLDYMHDRNIAHLGLNIGDLMVTRPNGRDIKIGDLSLARSIRKSKLLPLEFGMPEYVAPEIVKEEGVSFPADMWAVGVITYLLLSGTSPFRGENDRETLTSIKNGELRFDMEAFANLSHEAKDFVAKLLQYKPENRLNVKEALLHPWMKFAEITPRDPYRINTDRLRTYASKYKDWYANASCRRWFRRRPLVSAFTHPSKMVYPPGEIYTPPDTPEREVVPAKPKDYTLAHRDFTYEVGMIQSDSHYQQGPDTYLLQLRDTDFPVRLRQYMNVARVRHPNYTDMFTGRDTSYDYERIPIVHERRRFTDIMDEEIDDERRRTMIDKYTAEFVRSKQSSSSLEMPRRVRQEVTSRYTIREDVQASKEIAEHGRAPFLREKPQTTAVTPNMDITLTCVVSGNPEPVVQWFRNDIILGDTHRMTITNKGCRSQLSIKGIRDFDVGYYKVVARNNIGQAFHKFRLIRGEIPGMCDPPEVQNVSGTQALLKWRTPIDDGGAPTECYHLQIKPLGEIEWLTVSDTISQETYLVDKLKPVSGYQFRVAAKNIRGWGEFSISTAVIRTGARDDPILQLPLEQRLQQKNPKLQVLQLPGSRGEIRDILDYGRELQPVPLKTGEGAMLQMRKYKMVVELAKGQFSRVFRCIRQDDQRTFACKVLLRGDREEVVKNEYEMMKSLRHERLVTLYETYHLPTVTTLVMEFLGGPDILTFLSNKLEYTEQNVATVINQVLDGISYLHWRGLCHLNLQPDNVVATSWNKLDVKLVDFGSVQKVEKTGTSVKVNGALDYIAPEIHDGSKAYPNSDVWSLGVLAYVLLTGTSPFVGLNDEETKENIQYVRFKFETLGGLVSQEATRFIMLIFKRDPSKRPTENECREHKWLNENDFMLRKRERTALSINRLREYTNFYHNQRERQASKSQEFSSYCSEC